MASAYYKIWRIKQQNFNEGETDVPLYRRITTMGQTSYAYGGVKKVKVRRGTCNNPANYIYLKFLANDGKYKFIQFDRIHTEDTTSENIGKVSKLNTSFISGQGSSYNIGYTGKRFINASVMLDNEAYKTASDIFTSPRVYMQVNETDELTDNDSNWLLVTVENEGGSFNTKKNSQRLSLRIELPEMQTITM